MKTLFVGIFFIFTSLAFCQWVEHIIENGDIGGNFPPTEVKLSDIDNDGLSDIVYLRQSNGLYWYKNLGGGNFEPQELIINPLTGEQAGSFDTGDLNNNGFTDVVVSYFTVDGGVYWYENLDGQGTFNAGSSLQIPSGAKSRNARIADIDGDGKQDIVVSFSFQSQVARVMWFKNLGNGQFDSGTVIIQDGDFQQEFEIGDIDGDGDLDIVIGSNTLNRMSWFENTDGQGTFSAPKPIGDFNMAVQRLALGDINGNGFLDVVGSSSTIESLIWWENLDGQGNFSEENIIKSGIQTFFGPFITDVNNDGNQDIIHTNFNELLWFDNLEGAGNFGESLIIKPSGSLNPNIYDVNEDGNMDVILFCINLMSFCWLENSVLSTQSFTKFQATVVPNPAREKTTISTNQPIDKIELFTILGQKFVFEGSKITEQSIQMGAFSAGLYFMTVYSGGSKETIKLIKE